MTTHYVSEAKAPPGGFQPFTIKAVVATILGAIGVDGSTVIEGIITLRGNRVTPADIRSAISNVTPPGQQFATRMIGPTTMKIWRLR